MKLSSNCVQTKQNQLRKKLTFVPSMTVSCLRRKESSSPKPVRKVIAKIDRLQGKKPDNTAQNYGDARKESPTPQVQSEKKADIAKLQSIRKALVNDKSLSSSAKNVKVVVINGTVTLRGVVDSATEKAKVASAAKQYADDSKVLDELEVNTK